MINSKLQLSTNKGNPFPKLMSIPAKGLTVLMVSALTEKGVGVVVVGDKSKTPWEPGHFSQDWDINQFTDLPPGSKVTLEVQ